MLFITYLRVIPLGDSNQLEVDGPMLLGGLGPPFAEIVPPAALWTAVLKQGFVGCLRDFNVNARPVDVAGFARQQDSGEYFQISRTKVMNKIPAA